MPDVMAILAIITMIGMEGRDNTAIITGIKIVIIP